MSQILRDTLASQMQQLLWECSPRESPRVTMIHHGGPLHPLQGWSRLQGQLFLLLGELKNNLVRQKNRRRQSVSRQPMDLKCKIKTCKRTRPAPAACIFVGVRAGLLDCLDLPLLALISSTAITGIYPLLSYMWKHIL